MARVLSAKRCIGSYIIGALKPILFLFNFSVHVFSQPPAAQWKLENNEYPLEIRPFQLWVISRNSNNDDFLFMLFIFLFSLHFPQLLWRVLRYWEPSLVLLHWCWYFFCTSIASGASIRPVFHVATKHRCHRNTYTKWVSTCTTLHGRYHANK